MKRYFFSGPVQVLLVGLLLVTGAGEAVAALGQSPTIAAASAAASGARMLAATPAANGRYTVHEVLLESGTTVREYTDPAGIVFAVSWKGPVLPDFGAMLGSYFTTFQLHTEQARNSGIRRAPVNMERDGLVVHSQGHMRNFFGNAYAPSLVPTDVNINDVLQ